jgi:23S rRNA (guanosine2251-2'-O)-methyltransferase
MNVIGRKPVLELLQSGKQVQRVKIALGTQGAIIADIIKEAKKRKVRVDRVPPEQAKRSFGTGNHQGVIAETVDITTFDIKDIDKRVKIKHGLLIALDGVTDPFHLGAVARSALAAGCDGIIIPARRSAPLSEVAMKSSAGTLNRLPVIQVGNLNEAMLSLQKSGWWIHGAAGEGSDTLWDHEWDEKTVLVVGAEGKGISTIVKRSCDHLVVIPMSNNVESLSASAAASVILFDISRKRDIR